MCAGDWVQQKAVKDKMLRVFVRHINYDTFTFNHNVRLFVAERGSSLSDSDASSTCSSSSSSCGKSLEGFVLLDPMYSGAEVFGYVTSICRMVHGGHPGECPAVSPNWIAVSHN